MIQYQEQEYLTSDTRVASANWLVLVLLSVFLDCRLFDRLGESTRDLWFNWSWLWCDRRLGSQLLSSAIDDLSVADKALNEPMALTRAVSTTFDASLAQIVVSIIADVAMVVLIGHRSIASIAEDGPRAGGRAGCFGIYGSWLGLLDAKSKLTVARDVCQLCEEALTTQTSGHSLLGCSMKGRRGLSRCFRAPHGRRHRGWMHEGLKGWLSLWCRGRNADTIGSV
jgi:hypothetical protein